jgi:hypothetical protein
MASDQIANQPDSQQPTANSQAAASQQPTTNKQPQQALKNSCMQAPTALAFSLSQPLPSEQSTSNREAPYPLINFRPLALLEYRSFWTIFLISTKHVSTSLVLSHGTRSMLIHAPESFLQTSWFAYSALVRTNSLTTN